MGGNSFACESSTTYSSYYAWKAFDNNEATSSGFETSAGENSYLTFYNPTAIKVTNLGFRVGTTSGSFAAYTPGHVIVYGSNSNDNWSQLADYTNTYWTQNSYWYLDMSNNSSAYKYHKLALLTNAGGGSFKTYRSIVELRITAYTGTTAYTYYWDKTVS